MAVVLKLDRYGIVMVLCERMKSKQVNDLPYCAMAATEMQKKELSMPQKRCVSERHSPLI